MKFFILIAFYISNLWAFPNDFKLINDRTPIEFNVLFESMKNSLRDPVKQAELAVICNKINKGLAPLKVEQVKFLIMSEIYKTILEWKFPKNESNFSSSDLKRILFNRENNQNIYTPFSTSIILSIVADAERIAIDDNKLQNAEKKQIQQYVGKWLKQADNLSPTDFNALTLEVSWEILKRIERESILFQELSSKAIEDVREDTFNIPQLNIQQPASKPKTPNSTISVSEQSEEIKEQSEKAMQKIGVTPGDISSDDFSNAINKIDAEDIKSDSSNGSGAPSPLK